MKFFALSLLVSSAYAACPNACSGNGRCSNYQAVFSTSPTQAIELQAVAGTINILGYDTSIAKKDSCTCFTHKGHDGATVYQYTGPDCSLFTCPYAPAFAGPPGSLGEAGDTAGTVYHTQSVECSLKGICDRATGQCMCTDGYEGEACQRTSCPNDCSSAGRCMTLKQIAEDVLDSVGSYYGSYMSNALYTAWDSEQSMGCWCDEGRSGADCSIVDCPSSGDVMGGDGAESGRACSGRGSCDYTNGQCNCYNGYFGSSCTAQRNAFL